MEGQYTFMKKNFTPLLIQSGKTKEISPQTWWIKHISERNRRPIMRIEMNTPLAFNINFGVITDFHFFLL